MAFLYLALRIASSHISHKWDISDKRNPMINQYSESSKSGQVTRQASSCNGLLNPPSMRRRKATKINGEVINQASGGLTLSSS